MSQVTVVDDKYRLIGLRSEDDVVAVYDAEQVATDSAICFTLFRHPALQIEPGREAFLCRMRRHASVSHPGLVRQLGLGTYRDQPYLATEPYRGETLKASLQRQGLIDPATACEVMLQVLAALAAVHAQGLTHGGLSPNAILLEFGPDEIPMAKVLDCALPEADVDREVGLDSNDPTSALYQPPEQLMRRRFDQRADVYAVGAMLYEMVTGQHLFAGTSSLELIARVVAGDAPLANTINPEVPPGLARAIARALEPGLEQRTLDVQHLARAIAPFVQRDPDDHSRPLRPIDPILKVETLRIASLTAPATKVSEPSEVSQELLISPVFPKSPLIPRLGKSPRPAISKLRDVRLSQGFKTAALATAAGSAVGALLAWIVASL